MLSYRHGFHAGNFADVHKHAVLTLLVQALQRKKTALCYVDTHAGAALYDLHHEFAAQRQEHVQGIDRLWRRTALPAAIAPYLAAVRKANGLEPGMPGPLRYYPGSPQIVHGMLRAQDRMVLMELHTTEAPLLLKRFARDRRVSVHHQDGYQGLKAFLPPPERRGLVMIDPSYERSDEFERVVAGVREIHRRWATGMVAIWYPLQKQTPVARFYRLLRDTGIRRMLLCEFLVAPEDTPKRLYGSGMIVINPPWQIDRELSDLLAWLDPLLSQGTHPAPRVAWLVPE